MKPSEIVASLPEWANATSEALLASPAWAMPCRLGEKPCTMRLDALRPADTLDIAILLEDEPHTLSLVDTSRFQNLHAVWAERAEVPEPIMLALIEKECGELLQLIENAARRQLKIVGLAGADAASGERLCARLVSGGEYLFSFAITSTPSLVRTLGRLAFIDASHSSVRETSLPAVAEIAAFTMPHEDLAVLAPGDFLLLPEVGTVAPRLIVDGRFAVDVNGVSPWTPDSRLRVVETEARTVTLGELFKWSGEASPNNASGLKLERNGQTIATGRPGKLAEHPAMIIESKE